MLCLREVAAGIEMLRCITSAGHCRMFSTHAGSVKGSAVFVSAGARSCVSAVFEIAVMHKGATWEMLQGCVRYTCL